MRISDWSSDVCSSDLIDQESYSIDAKLSHEWTLGKTALKVGFARFDDKQRETENQIDFDVDYDEDEVPVFEQVFTATDIVDKEFTVKLEHEIELGNDIQFVAGGYYQKKQRTTAILDADGEAESPGLATSYDRLINNPPEPRKNAE